MTKNQKPVVPGQIFAWNGEEWTVKSVWLLEDDIWRVRLARLKEVDFDTEAPSVELMAKLGFELKGGP